jgi:hypothetical protein
MPDLPAPSGAPFHTRWTQSLPHPLRGVALAREAGRILAWDERDWLYLFNAAGQRQGQVQRPGLTAAAAADDGSAVVAAGGRGELWWLGPDLRTRWERAVPRRAVAAALDPFGQYVAVADAASHLHLFDRAGRAVWRVQTPRPLLHLAFVPAAARLVASADYGLVAGFDAAGRGVWRDGLVSHVGSLAVTGTGDRTVLACFSDGLQQYSLEGHKLAPVSVSEGVRLAAVAFDGGRILVVTRSERLLLLTGDGQVVGSQAHDPPVSGMALGALGDYAVVARRDGGLAWITVAVPTAA